MSWDRIRRQEEILREKIATIVVERLSDPRMGFVTVTRVELTRDRREATVFYTVLGEDSQRRTTERALNSAAPHIQERVGKTLRMRRTPILRFTYDDSVEKESRMRVLLDEVSAEWSQPTDADPNSNPNTDTDTDTDRDIDRDIDAGRAGHAESDDARSTHQDRDAAGASDEDRPDRAGDRSSD